MRRFALSDRSGNSDYNIFMLRRSFFLGLAVLMLASLLNAQTEKRLILKDGSYQKVTKYEIKGDRVRYYSAERYDWEEVPKELVDWAATEKYNEDSVRQAVDAAQRKAEREKEAAINAKQAISPQVAPNLRLPESGGVFVVDQYHNTPQLVELTQSTSLTSDHMTSYLLLHKIDPLANKKQTVEIPGEHSKIQLHVTRPTIYLNVESDSATEAATRPSDIEPRPSSDAYRYKIIQLDPKHKSRLVETILTNVADESTQKMKKIPTVGELAAGNIWIKITPKENLEPGEYAVVQELASGGINPYVWDFGVNPSAPQNRPFVPTTKKQAENTGGSEKGLKD